MKMPIEPNRLIVYFHMIIQLVLFWFLIRYPSREDFEQVAFLLLKFKEVTAFSAQARHSPFARTDSCIEGNDVRLQMPEYLEVSNCYLPSIIRSP